MPFCSTCGNQVSSTDTFCARCGTRQPQVSAIPQDPLVWLTPRMASILCYIPGLGWIASIVVLASQKYRQNRTVRFHAFQGLYLFVAWLMDDIVLRPMLFGMAPTVPLYHIVKVVLLVMSIFMIIKAAHDEPYSLPLFGELAHRSVTED